MVSPISPAHFSVNYLTNTLSLFFPEKVAESLRGNLEI
jgi:hypothetical protein